MLGKCESAFFLRPELCVEVDNYRRVVTTIQTNRPGTDSLVLPSEKQKVIGEQVVWSTAVVVSLWLAELADV